MGSHSFIKEYTRTTAVQDFEVRVVHPIFFPPNTPITEALYIGNDHNWEAWYHADEFMALMRHYADKITDPAWSLVTHFEQFEKNKNDILSSATALSACVFDHFDPIIALQKYRVFCDVWLPYSLYIWTPWAITYVLDEWFQKELVARYGEQEGHSIYEELAVSSRPVQMQQCIEALLGWKIRGGSDDEIENLRF